MRGGRITGGLSLVAMLLSGCAHIPDSAPQVPVVEADQLGLSAVPTPAIGLDWWQSLGDPQLARLMEAALADNPDLAGALARVRSAEAALAEQDAGRLPQITADGSLQRDRLSGEYQIPPPYAGSTRWIATAQANLDWNLDFWGRQAALIAQAGASRDATRLDAAAARLAISGAVAQSYVTLARAWELVDVAQEFVASRQSALSLVQVRKRNKLASDFDERAAETLLAQAQQAQVRAERDRDLAVHALAALIGRGADAYAEIERPSLSLDSALPIPDSLPVDLLGRRPDILAARVRIDSATAGRRVAETAFYPNVSLQALVGLQAIGLGSFFKSNAATYGGGPAIHLPIFEGGRLRAQYAEATAAVDDAVAGYDKTVLGAVQDVSDALTQVASDRQDAAQQERILAGLSQTVHLNEVRMRTGLGSQLDILDSNNRLLEARQARAAIAAAGAIHRIQLLIAVGGGFDPADPRVARTSAQPKAQS